MLRWILFFTLYFRINNTSMASVDISSNRGPESSTVILPAVTNPDHVRHRQHTKRRKMNRTEKISPDRNTRQHKNGTSKEGVGGESHSSKQESQNTTERVNKTAEFSHTGQTSRGFKHQGTRSSSSPYTDFSRSPLQRRTDAPSNFDNEKRITAGPRSRLRPLGSSRTTRTDTDGVLNRFAHLYHLLAIEII